MPSSLIFRNSRPKPSSMSFSPESDVGLLLREAAKKRRHLPIRKLLATISLGSSPLGVHHEAQVFAEIGIDSRTVHKHFVVDDEIDSGGGFEGADISPLAADYPAFHVVGRKGDHRNSPLLDVLTGVALNGDTDDALGPVVGLLLGVVFHLFDPEGRGAPRLVDADLLDLQPPVLLDDEPAGDGVFGAGAGQAVHDLPTVGDLVLG